MNDPASASTIKSLPWVADGIDDAELEDVQLLAYLAAIHPSVFNALLTKSWIADSPDETEQELMAAVKSIADEDASAALHVLTLPFLETLEPDDVPAVDSLAFLATAREGNNFRVFNALIGKPWVSDGLEEAELKVLDDIRSIADSDESAALQTLALPFLDTIEPDDGLTVDSLLRLVVYRQSDSPDIFNALIEKPWVSDGLDETERVIVGNIRWIADHDESAGLQLLASPFLDAIDPDDSVTMETLLTFRQDYGQQLSIDPISALIKKSWVADGLDDVEIQLVDNIRWIADNSKSAALRVIALPFLDTFEPGDSATVESFAHLLAYVQGNPLSILDTLVEMSWVADGFNETELEAVSKIWSLTDDDESVALAILAKPWIADGFDGVETEILEDIRRIADNDQSAALKILDLPFLDALDSGDSNSVETLVSLAADGEGNNLELFEAFTAKSWVPDGLNDAELGVVRDIRWIADNEQSAALRILDMPFLDVVQTSDRYAVAALNRIARHSREHSLRLMQHPLIHDGISDRTAKIIPILPHFVNKDEPDWDLVDTLLEPNNDLLEERTITLPLAGEVDLAIIRTTPGSPRNMGYLEHAVRVNEEFTGVPFPTDYVAVLFADVPGTGGGGGHYGSHIVGGPLHDNGGDEYVTTYSHGLLAHETAHYYWRYGKIWINEGAASFMTEIAQIARIGRPWRDHFVLCSHVDTIAELDAWSPSYGEIGSACHNALGERLFMDLYRELGDSEFRKGFRNLYLLTQIQGDECEGTNLTVCHLRVAYIHDADEEAAAIAERIIARWYDGTEPYAPTEVIPPDPFIPSIDGRVLTFVSARHGGASIEGLLSASDKMPSDQPHLRLTLNYNYPPQEPNREVEFKVLSYFEDGFAFHSNTVSFTLQSGHRGVSSQWVAVGLDSRATWPEGRYWISVYLDDVKVGEETFEIVS